jgi:peptidoglycan/xylan/chitin deacetylase (PgdA/CDA1 family)
MRHIRPGIIAGCIYPEAVCRFRTDKKLLCLTFDDGPDPYSTPALLDILESFKVSAVFFCSGRAAETYPELVRTILARGHMTGNHGYDHPDGWRTPTDEYLSDIEKAAPFSSSGLMRPPYGRMRQRQYRKLREIYKIVLWDVMPYDFDSRSGRRKSLDILKRKIRPGSIIVLHDRPGTAAAEILPDFIRYAHSEGYRFIVPFRSTGFAAE